MTDITQHVFKRRDAPSEDCRPPEIYRYTGNEDEGSVRLTGYHHPAQSRLYYGHPGMAGQLKFYPMYFCTSGFVFSENLQQ